MVEPLSHGSAKIIETPITKMTVGLNILYREAILNCGAQPSLSHGSELVVMMREK